MAIDGSLCGLQVAGQFGNTGFDASSAVFDGWI